MRIRELRLLRYGKFTDRLLALPHAPQDIHLVVGANEAGKSTMRRALSDWLFGFPMRSTGMDFLHPMQDLRLGGIIEDNTASREEHSSGQNAAANSTETGASSDRQIRSLNFERRKGQKNTLRTPADEPLPDSTLQEWLGSLQADEFRRMYALDHATLVEGSESILQASDDIGRMLFQAAAGIEHLGDALKTLQQEADSLWAPRKSGNRIFYQQQDAYEEARRTLGQAQLRTRDWKESHDALTDVQHQLDEARSKHAEIQQHIHRLERIRRVQPLLRDAEAARQRQEALQASGMPPLLPEDARQIFEQASRQGALVQAELTRLQTALNELDQALAALTLDTPILARADEITRLDEARVQCHDHPARLQRHQEKLQMLQARVKALAAELGWPAEDEAAMARRLPDPAWRERMAELIHRHQALQHAVEKARHERDAQTQNLNQWQAQLQSLASEGIDPALSDLLEQARRLGDPDTQSDALASERQRLDAALEATLASMGPWRQPIDRLQAMLVPEASQVDTLRVQQHDDGRALQARQDALQKKIQDIQHQEQALLQLVRHHQPVSREDVAQARQQRDDDWQAIKADPATLPTRARAFEARMHEADTLADARLERAKHEADRQSCANQLEKLKLERTGIESDIQAIETRMARRLADWQAQAAACGLPDLPLDAAPTWLKRHQDALELLAKRQTAEHQLQTLHQRVKALRQALTERLALPATTGLDDALRQARERLETAQRIAGQRSTLETQIQDAQRRLVPLQTALTQVESQWQEWQQAWQAALAEAGHEDTLPVEQLEARLARMQDIQTLLAQMDSLRADDIEPLQNALDSWMRHARTLADQLMPDASADISPQDIALTLAGRLKTAHQDEADHDRLQQQQARDRQALEAARQQQIQVDALLQPLRVAAGIDDMAQLGPAIARSEERRHIEHEIQRIETALREAGDGQSLESLRTEAASIKPDQLQVELNRLGTEAGQVVEEISRLGAQHGQLKAAFDALNGSDAAARAAARQQEAAAGMAEAAERYLRLKTAARLLQWSMERFRQTRQGPMLARASEIFQALTLGSFSRLLVDAESHDSPRLVSIRTDGNKPVEVPGLSEGTRDQLYLALRLAALDQQASQGSRMPLIADDLFINFDDRRTEAGLQVLGEVSRRMQVILLTHHDHLVPLARQVLGDGLNVIEL
ncbi:ATP-binding protein [Lautropia mirabilis]|uniref:ATP-binding protein n=1 Tax=Lautropia mirabilis TaxID=47671 RepID=UPI0028EB60A1|nr:AAA family ATPase [Lautropia mirabilis]